MADQTQNPTEQNNPAVPELTPIASSPEQRVEQPEQPEYQEQQEQYEQQVERTIPQSSGQDDTQQQPAQPPVVPAQQPPVQSLGKSEQLQHIEGVLEEGLEDAFATMNPQEQQMFKAAGEQTAHEIEGALSAVKVQTQRIFELIKSWLRMIPGVSKWYIVQESKIKTDKIITLKHE